MMTAHDKNWVEQMLLGWMKLSEKERKEVYKVLKKAKWYWLNANGDLEPYKDCLSFEEVDNVYWEATPEGLLGKPLLDLDIEELYIELPGGWLITSWSGRGNYVFKAPDLGITYITPYEHEDYEYEYEHSSIKAKNPWLVVYNGLNLEEEEEPNKEKREMWPQVREFLEHYPDLLSLLNDCIVLKGRFLKLGNYVLMCNPTKLVTNKPVVGDKRLLLTFKYSCVREEPEASLVPA